MSNENKNKKMTEEPKLKWGGRTAARADGAGYLIGIGLVGYNTGLKDVIIAEVHESVAYGACPKTCIAHDVFMEKPRAGAYCTHIKLKDLVHEES